MRERHEPSFKSARRVGTQPASATFSGNTIRPGWLLRGWSLAFLWPLFIRLFGGDGVATAGLLAGGVLLWLAGDLMAAARRIEEELEAGERTLPPRLPRRLAGAVLAGLGAALFSWAGAHDSLFMALLFGVLAATGCRLVYGADPLPDRQALEAAAAQAGVKAPELLAAVEEARAKIRAIEERAAALGSRPLAAKIAAIGARARAVIAQIERDPRDLARARRFLVTYLDGTRDVVARYAEQQHDLAGTGLDESFVRLLDTIEQVFAEQEDVLKRDDRLDLEVKIEVLEKQLRLEGIH
ncbi:5-bromo-4-chloroindolyl phosphate hydrolysis family protein [Marinimicrococcus flavescens]|uniref:5-bromo-4-chloroindolyl phosphate hydrolysis family protein n=1 Tax=Marinimicrococcus flavescens TaxID=3031815 RepID=A0AAP3XRF5_9PROT|nr:5-bromo-4-chloroindolyl phosphate hydrolysis family protein [Marinimicrococcus flavescens]